MALLDNMPFVMKTFNFEGNGIESGDVLVNVLNCVLKKRLSYASWPETDVERTILKTDQLARSELKMKLDVLRKQFENRFGRIKKASEGFTIFFRGRRSKISIFKYFVFLRRLISSAGPV